MRRTRPWPPSGTERVTGQGGAAPPSGPREENPDQTGLDLYGLTPDLSGAIEAALDDSDLARVEALVVPLHAADMARRSYGPGVLEKCRNELLGFLARQ